MKTIILTICLTILTGSLLSQEYVLDKNKSELVVLGTSTIHDWESTVDNFDVKAKFDGEMIRDIKFSAVVKSIKSGKSGMDKNTYIAMKAEDFPKILFESNLTIKGTKATGKGKLTIAGASKEIPVELSVTGTEKKVISGDIKLKMTDYGIEPPVAVFGTIKTGNEIIIRINFTLNKD